MTSKTNHDPASEQARSTTSYVSSCASVLEDEVNLLSRLIYLNKNQHRASLWFHKSQEAYRWSKKILKIFLNGIDVTDLEWVKTIIQLIEESQARLLRTYGAIMQSVARTAFMSNGLVIIASISRLRAIYECAGGFLQHYNRSDQASQSLKTVSTGDKAGHSNPTSSSQSLLIDPINSKAVLPTPRPNDPPQTPSVTSTIRVDEVTESTSGRSQTHSPTLIADPSNLLLSRAPHSLDGASGRSPSLLPSTSIPAAPSIPISKSNPPGVSRPPVPKTHTMPNLSQNVDPTLKRRSDAIQRSLKKKKTKRDELDDIFGDL